MFTVRQTRLTRFTKDLKVKPAMLITMAIIIAMAFMGLAEYFDF